MGTPKGTGLSGARKGGGAWIRTPLLFPISHILNEMLQGKSELKEPTRKPVFLIPALGGKEGKSLESVQVLSGFL